jgi:peptide/nickel transport system permease protein
MGGTAGMVRIMRANLLDELGKPYVTTALAKGLHPIRLVIKYPLRIALNPFISTVGWMLPHLISGAAIIAVVLSLPTTGPLLLDSLKNQDMYLAGSFLLMLSALTVIGTLLSDILLAITDPRIRYE